MQTEVSVELGAQDDCLEIPWASPEGEVRYYDLRRRPELLLNVTEAHHNRELGEFLASINSEHSILETAKCDTWLSNEMTEEESIYGASWKFGSYIDLIFNDPGPRLSLERHEEFADSTSRLLRRVPEIPAAAELVVRRCYYHDPESQDPEASEAGYHVTFYLHGYGDDETEARQRWAIALKVVENALLQLSATQRRAAAAG
ncbi:MAG: hypothetical protein ACRD2K_02620 [Terriglobales bacterium]